MCSQQLLESYGYGRGTKYHVYGIEVATFDGKVATSHGKVATSKRRMSREELMNMILEVCDEWRTLDEICVLEGKNSKYLRKRVLPQMSDILEKMYESIPNHPRQKYRARQKEE